MKTIEGFSTTQDAANCRKAVEARVEGGRQLQTPAPFIRKAPVQPLLNNTTTVS